MMKTLICLFPVLFPAAVYAHALDGRYKLVRGDTGCASEMTIISKRRQVQVTLTTVHLRSTDEGDLDLTFDERYTFRNRQYRDLIRGETIEVGASRLARTLYSAEGYFQERMTIELLGRNRARFLKRSEAGSAEGTSINTTKCLFRRK